MWQMILIIYIALLFTLLSYVYPYKSENIRQLEKKSNNLIVIYIIRFLHFCTFSFSILYLFIFPQSYDVYYILFSILLSLHWKYFNGECALSLWEKQMLDPHYTSGDDTTYHPFIDIYSKDLNRFLVMIMFVSMFIVFFRFFISILISIENRG